MSITATITTNTETGEETVIITLPKARASQLAEDLGDADSGPSGAIYDTYEALADLGLDPKGEALLSLFNIKRVPGGGFARVDSEASENADGGCGCGQAHGSAP